MSAHANGHVNGNGTYDVLQANGTPEVSPPASPTQPSTQLQRALKESSDVELSQSLLSDLAILHHYQASNIVIHPFNLAHLSTSSYDVTLGEYYYRESECESGQTVFNPYSRSHVDRVWGAPHRAERASEWSARTGQPLLENIAADDRIIWLKPSETILGHTNEFIGGRHSITTMMKARSSMGRNFIEVCKCFTADTRLMTQRGFKFVADITVDDAIATYNPATTAIEFHRPTLVFSKTSTAGSGPHKMVHVKQKHDADNINLSTTADHEWFVKSGVREKNAKEVYYDEEKDYAKVAASNLVGGAGVDDRACFSVLTAADAGLAKTIAFPHAARLGLTTAAHVDAFMKFYGYWLGNGTIEPIGHISCTTTQPDNIQQLFDALGFKRCVDYQIYDEFTSLKRFQISKRSWNVFFIAEYGQKYGRKGSVSSRSTSSTADADMTDEIPDAAAYIETDDDEDVIEVDVKAPSTPANVPEFTDCEKIFWPDEDALLDSKSAKWMALWVFDLSSDLLKQIIAGIIMADGRSATEEVIFTSSVRMRDHLLRVLLYAGYSPHFIRYREAATVATVNGWQVFVGRSGESVLDRNRDVTTSEMHGTVYCLTVPNNLVFAQTAKVENNVVTECSKTLIIGQCAGWGDIGYTGRWTMEITNNSRYYSIPLVVGRRIAQIVFFNTDGVLQSGQRSYESTGKYQRSSELAQLIMTWQPSDMLPKMYADREVRQIIQNSLNTDKTQQQYH